MKLRAAPEAVLMFQKEEVVILVEVKDMYLSSLARGTHCDSLNLKPDDDARLPEMVIRLIEKIKTITTLEDLDTLEESLGADSLIAPAIEHARSRLKKKLLPEAWTKLSVLPKRLVEHLLGRADPNVSKKRNEELRVLLSNYIAAASLNDIQTLTSHWSKEHHGKENRLKYNDFVWKALQKKWVIYQQGRTRPFFSLE